ncbi:aspartate aminotransferase family protein, partial [Mesorhizobium sp. M0954]
AAIAHHQAHYVISGAASLFRIHPKQKLPHDYREAYPSPDEAAAMKAMSRFFRNNGIVLPVDASACLSTAMSDADIDKIASVFERFLAMSVSNGEAR